MAVSMADGDGDGDNEGSDSGVAMVAASNNQEGRNKYGVKIKGGRTKRKSLQLHSLEDVFLWNPDTSSPKDLK